MIITLTGLPGSGKSTVAALLSERTKMRRYSIGDLFRKMAGEKGLRLSELNAQGESDISTDKDADEYQRKIGQTEDNFIIDGRLSWYFIPHSFKIFLEIDEESAAKRIFNASKQGLRPDEHPYKTLEEVREANKERIVSERKRYKMYYDVDYLQKDNYDLVIDTSTKTPEEIVQIIIDAIGIDKKA